MLDRLRPLLLAAIALLLLAPACDRQPQPATAPSPASAPDLPPTLPQTTPQTTPPVTTGVIHAVFRQKSGDIRVRLATAEAPRTSLAFIALAERGYFDGRPWTDFSPVVRQTGETIPLFTVPREFSPKLLHDVGGNLCVSNTSEAHDARAKPNRIFITVKEQDRWNLVYAVFGRVESGLDVALNMKDGEPIQSIAIEGDTSPLRARFAKDLAEWTKAMDGAKLPSVR